MTGELYEDFRRAVEGPDEAIDLARAALAIARTDYPNLDIGACISRLDELSIQVSQRLGSPVAHQARNATAGANAWKSAAAQNPTATELSSRDGDVRSFTEEQRPNAMEGTPWQGVYQSIAVLNHVLFDEEGYHGNTADYYDPKNSFLNEVIELKRGIPITLSILYIEIGRRIGLRFEGIGFPGHFLVKYYDNQAQIIIDPFNRGEIRSVVSLKKRLQDLYGGRIAFHPSLLEPVTKKQILQRMLNNLKAIYLRDNELLKSLSVLQRLLILEPNSAAEIRDRGAVYLKLECFSQALEDFEAYLRAGPETDEAERVRELVIILKKQVNQIH